MAGASKINIPSNKSKIVTIFGGNGFIGRNLVRDLAKDGFRIRIGTRNPATANHLYVSGVPGQIEVTKVNINSELSIGKCIEGSDYVINLIGILEERKKQRFGYIHGELPGIIAKYCNKYDVSRFIHMSSLGADMGSVSKYQRSKALGEASIKNENKNYTIIRPSIVFGYDDNFFNQFARILSLSPFFPLVGNGDTKFQPVYVLDLVKFIIMHLGDSNKKYIYEIGGKDIFSLREIIELILITIGKKRLLIPIPFSLSKIFIAPMQILPKKPITFDQLESLKTDNIITHSKNEDIGLLEDYAIEASSAKNIIPEYLGRFSS